LIDYARDHLGMMDLGKQDLGKGELGKTRPLLLGHRGARGIKSIPENTLASFDQALADGCDGFEFDVRLTADGKAVICHDPQSKGIEIARASVQELAGLPLLEDVLARYQNCAFLDIELKVSGLEGVATALLKKYPPRSGFVVSSFLPEVLRVVHAEESTIPLGLICETQAELRLWDQLPVDYVIPHHKLVDAKLIGQLHAAGKRILVWTVNASADMHRFADFNVDGIISDNPSLLCRTVIA
jgi:glycerophosphoryl diester phosphodiesterase